MKYLLTTFFLSTCFAQIQQKPLLRTKGNPLDEDFAKYANSIIDHLHVPSVSVAVIHNGKVYSDAYGTAVLPDIPATPETLYFVGSTTKSFTAAALTILMDDLRNTSSAFDWDTPVSTIIRDDFILSDEYITTHATLEDLASHRTGFPRHDLSYGTEGQKTIRDTVRNMRNLPFTAGFREKYQYCNYMWATLGHILETVSGMPEDRFLQERLWGKLGMNSTYWTLEAAHAAEKEEGKQLARGYDWDPVTSRFYTEPYIDIGPLAGAGSQISTVLNYAEYLRMMLHRTGPVSAEGHTQLRRARSFQSPDVVSPWGGIQAYTLGWDVKPYRGVNIRSHNGGLNGFGALMAYVPDMDWGVAMLSNAAGPGNFAEEVLFWTLLDDLLETPKEERWDALKYYDGRLEKDAKELNASRDTAFGGPIPNPPLPASLPITEYKGSYWSDGYKRLNFTVSKPNPRTPLLKDTSKPVLRASMLDRVWPSILELEHISGDFFLAWASSSKGDGAYEGTSQAFAAEFRIGADGRPSELGIAFEPSMGGEKIWFKRE